MEGAGPLDRQEAQHLISIGPGGVPAICPMEERAKPGLFEKIASIGACDAIGSEANREPSDQP